MLKLISSLTTVNIATWQSLLEVIILDGWLQSGQFVLFTMELKISVKIGEGVLGSTNALPLDPTLHLLG
jgi:hypothetical protein